MLGIQPKYNRLYLNPHVTKDVEGSEVVYRLRGRTFRIAYTSQGTTVTLNNITITSRGDFGVWLTDDGTLQLFTHDSETPTFSRSASTTPLHISLDATGVHVIPED